MKFLYMISVVFFASCITSGREFPSRFEWVQASKTKQDDVKLVMGTPQAVGNSGGVPTWTYGYYKIKLNGETLTKEVKFYWNANGTVQSYSFSSSFPSDISSTVKPSESVAIPPRASTAVSVAPASNHKPVTKSDASRPASDVSR